MRVAGWGSKPAAPSTSSGSLKRVRQDIRRAISSSQMRYNQTAAIADLLYIVRNPTKSLPSAITLYSSIDEDRCLHKLALRHQCASAQVCVLDNRSIELIILGINKYKNHWRKHSPRPEPSAILHALVRKWGLALPPAAIYTCSQIIGEPRDRTALRFTSSWNWLRSTLMPCPNGWLYIGMDGYSAGIDLIPFFLLCIYTGWPLYPRLIS